MGKAVFTGIVFVAGLVFTIMATDLQLVTERGQPGAGMVPVLAGVGIMVTTAYALIRQMIAGWSAAPAVAVDTAGGQATGEGVAISDEGYPIVPSAGAALASAGLILVMVALLPLIGVWVATALYAVASTFLLYRTGRVTAAIATLCVPIGVLILFDVVLGLDLPEGLLF